MRKQVFRVLKTGNFYFPYLYKGEKFEVLHTIDLEVDEKEFNLFEFELKHKSID